MERIEKVRTYSNYELLKISVLYSQSVGIIKKDQLDVNMKSLSGIFVLPAKDGTNKN